MHVSLKHARRVVLGVAMGALLLAAAPGSGRADILQICVSPRYQKVVLPLGGTCNKPNRAITWDSNGVAGPTRAARSQGYARTAGTDRHRGSDGTARSGRTGWSHRNAWECRSDGSDRSGWRNGSARTGRADWADRTDWSRRDRAGAPWNQRNPVLHAGRWRPWQQRRVAVCLQQHLGRTVRANRRNNAGCATPTCGNSPIYYGPGNGADTQLESVAVPIDASTVTQLWVQTKNAPGPGQSYTFQLCINSDCTTSAVTCSINLPTLTECNDLVAQLIRSTRLVTRSR